MAQNQEDRIVSLEKGQNEILDILRPMSETYTAIRQLGKWAAAIIVIISMIVGIILGLKSIIFK